MPIHPFLFGDLVAQEPLPILVLNLRNALLIVLAGIVIGDLGRPILRTLLAANAGGTRRSGTLGDADGAHAR
jgi:hypothetical protein